MRHTVITFVVAALLSGCASYDSRGAAGAALDYLSIIRVMR